MWCFCVTLTVVLLVAIVLFGAGCTYVRHESICTSFTGLRAATQPSTQPTTPSDAEQAPTVCMLFIHGMGGYSAGDPGNLIAAAKAAFKMHDDEGGSPPNIYPKTGPDQPTLLREVCVDDHGFQLRMYTLNWKPVSNAIKSQYLGYDSGSVIDKTRLSLDRNVRQDFIYECLGDVVVYAGVGKKQIQTSVKTALKTMHHDVEGGTHGKKYRYFIVTWSLGSKIAFDCLSPSVSPVATTAPDGADEQDALSSIARHTDSVFMLANQLPLLAMVDVKPTTDPTHTAATAEGLEGFARRRRSTATTGEAPLRPVSVVAVSDPNDVLSYPIPKWMMDRVPEFHFANVSISVAHWGLYIPGIFGGGWTINPETAHTAYGSDKEVIRLIIEGGTVK